MQEEKEHMEFNLFAEMVRHKVQREIADMAEVRVKRIMKNNSVKVACLTFTDRKSGLTPTIHLDVFYEKYRKGMSMEEIAKQMISCYQKTKVMDDQNFSYLHKWQCVRPLVAYKVVNRERNGEMLAKVPHKDFLDLSKVFYICLKELGGTILIDHQLCKQWGIGMEELEEAAEVNTPKLQPTRLQEMENLMVELFGADLCEFFGVDVAEGIEKEQDMYVLTNDARLFGAAAILFPGELQKIAERLDNDLYILPSSIHEVLLLPVLEDVDLDCLKEMVHEVNETAIISEELLSDRVYIYRRDIQQIDFAA